MVNPHLSGAVVEVEGMLAVFDVEFKHRDSPNTETALEKLRLSEDDFLSQIDILTVFTPFKDAQKFLEDESYIDLSLLSSVIHHLWITSSSYVRLQLMRKLRGAYFCLLLL